jgi:phosphate/phosphite/phosphonate ABC transporter binding protein
MSIRITLWSRIAIVLFLAHPGTVSNTFAKSDDLYRVGILAKRGEAITIERWQPTTDYLTQHIEGARFQLVPLGFDEVIPALQGHEIDFLLVNSGLYIQAEEEFGAFRIATMVSRRGDQSQNQFGGVIFTRSGDSRFDNLRGLKGKRFGAVDPTSLGGYLMARLELLNQGIDTERDLEVVFFHTHDAVVKAVLDGQVDAGTVRSDTLEHMAMAGSVDLQKIRVLNAQEVPGFPFRLSTALYPEWPMAALPNTPRRLVSQVAIALQELTEDTPAIRDSHIQGWTVPANYQPVHELYKALNLPPHRRPPPTLRDWTRYNPTATTLIIGAAILLAISLVVLTYYNRRLKLARQHLIQAVEKQQQMARELSRNLEKLRQSEETFSKLAEAALDAIVMLDPQGRVSFWNSAAVKIFGYSFEEARLLKPETWLACSGATNADHPNCILRYIGNSDSPLPGTTLELTSTRKSGDTFPVEVAASSVKINQDWHIICLIRDITQRKSLEMQRQQVEQQLSQHHKMTALSQLANGIAHEINTPIQTMLNNLDFLSEAFDDTRTLVRTQQRLVESARQAPPLQEAIAACDKIAEEIDLPFIEQEVEKTLAQSREGAQQISRIIRSMRVFATPDNPTPESCELNKLIEDVISVSRFHWYPVAHLDTELDASLPPVEIFPGELHQALLNLLMNAVQAIEARGKSPPGEIHIATHRKEDRVEVEIRDNGQGIPEEAKAHIFNPFFTTREVGQGSGQGLTLCHDIVVGKHHGTLSFESQADCGTTFTISLPLRM